MSEKVKPGDKVYIETTVVDSIVDESQYIKVNVKTQRSPNYGIDIVIPVCLALAIVGEKGV